VKKTYVNLAQLELNCGQSIGIQSLPPVSWKAQTNQVKDNPCGIANHPSSPEIGCMDFI
jgi:hypothetical protein